MKVKEKTHRYIEWISPEDMHTETVQWLSELNFVRDEQDFLNRLVKHYTIQLADARRLDKSRAIVGAILEAEKEVKVLMKKIQAHENQLNIMVDDIDQPAMERAYKETHKELMILMQRYLEEYRELKKQLFELVSKVIKKEKQQRLLN
ncbi:MAG: hypothetical protein WBM43_13070 [Flavobacteriaceae bacterium]